MNVSVEAVVDADLVPSASVLADRSALKPSREAPNLALEPMSPLPRAAKEAHEAVPASSVQAGKADKTPIASLPMPSQPKSTTATPAGLAALLDAARGLIKIVVPPVQDLSSKAALPAAAATPERQGQAPDTPGPKTAAPSGQPELQAKMTATQAPAAENSNRRGDSAESEPHGPSAASSDRQAASADAAKDAAPAGSLASQEPISKPEGPAAAPSIGTTIAAAAVKTPPPPSTAFPSREGGAPPSLAAFAAQIAAKAVAGARTFDIRLDPPELGRVEVKLTVSSDGRAEAELTADRPHTLDLLQRGSHELERALKSEGLELSNNSLNFSLKGEHRQGDGGGAFTAHKRSLSSAVVARAEAANASEPINLAAHGSARLDIRV